MKQKKYIFGYKLFVNYGQGWEFEQFEPTRQGFLTNAKLYRENCPYPQKWAWGKELREPK